MVWWLLVFFNGVLVCKTGVVIGREEEDYIGKGMNKSKVYRETNGFGLVCSKLPLLFK